MSNFKSGDDVLAEYLAGVRDSEFICGPDAFGMSCVKFYNGGLYVVEHKNIKPKPKTITIEIPKPGRVDCKIHSITLIFNDPEDANKARLAISNDIGEG